jgi:hypothetical protein
MNARITDRKALESLRPPEVAAYLRSAGWALVGRFAETATVWRLGQEQVLLPNTADFGDYARRVAELVETVSQFESRSQLEVYRDLSTAAADVVRVRVCSAVALDGSVVLEEGVRLVECAKDMVLSAARAAIAPKAYFRSRLPLVAEDYMRKVRLGQTEHGSYVVTVVCPVSPELHQHDQSLATMLDEPYDRKVTRVLAGALSRSAEAATQAALTGNLEPFSSAVSNGVSANLCAALAEIGKGLEDGQIEVSFSWSRTRTRPDVPSSKIVVPHDSLPVMREAARILRETYTEDDFELVGPVLRLESPSAAQGGTVIVLGEVDTPRRIIVRLDGPNYREAVRAHQEGLIVRCRGRLEKEGRYFSLSEIRHFSIDDVP